MKYVIIGNSAAAVGCIEGIRKTDASGEILLVSDETYRTYSRPLISYWLSGKVNDDGMYYRPADFYEKKNVTTKLGERCTAIDAENKNITLSGGEVISYDKLFVATGSRPFVPPIEGVKDCASAVTFSSWDSAKKLKEITNEKSRVVILGAGLIGLKVCEGLAGHVGSVTVVEMAGHLMPSILDDESAAIVQKHMEKNGVSFIYKDPVLKASNGTIELGSGRKLDFDVFVVAAGVRANIELVKDAGGNTNRGIIIDERMQTSLSDVYSAGDCVETVDVVSGDRKIMALLPNAYMQGEAAGINMAGGDKIFDRSMPLNAIGFFGLPLVTAGISTGETYVEKGDNTYRKLVFNDGRLVGYILVNEIDRAGIYTALIRERVDLSSVDMELLKKRPQLMMFGKSDRKRILAGGGISNEN